MKKTTPLLCIDIGSFYVRAAVFQITDSLGLKLLGYAENEIEQPFSQEIAPNSLREAVRKTVNAFRIKSARVACSVSGQLVFTRIVRLPSTAQNQISKMVRFEAQQNVPFKIDEVVWDYQLLSGQTSSDIDCIIVAIKSEILEQINNAVVSCGYLPEIVDVAPLAVYNSMRFNYPSTEGCELLIDIGARSTQLIFSEVGRVFVRGVPIAGNHITQAISQDLKENLQASELLKVGKGFVGLGGGYEDPPDITAARISKIIRSVMTRLHAEISRSISFYRSQHRGSFPTRVLLSGGSSSLSYMDLFFKEKLTSPVEYFNPLRNVEVDPSLNVEFIRLSAHKMGCLVGLATRFVSPAPIEINLLPVSTKNRLEAKRRSAILAVTAVTLTLAFAVPVFSNIMEHLALSSELRSVTAELTKRKELLTRLVELENKFQNFTDEAQQIRQLISDKQRWKDLLMYLNDKAVVGMWITKIQPLTNGTPSDFFPRKIIETRTVGTRTQQIETGADKINGLFIQGFYESYDMADVVEGSTALGATGESRAAEFVNNLLGEGSPFSTTLEEIEKNPNRFTRTVDNVGNVNIALPFTVTLDLQQPIKLLP